MCTDVGIGIAKTTLGASIDAELTRRLAPLILEYSPFSLLGLPARRDCMPCPGSALFGAPQAADESRGEINEYLRAIRRTEKRRRKG
jgi:hypothetical protein